MPSYTKQAKSATSQTKQIRRVGTKAGRFGLGTFGQARFSISDGFTKVAKPSTSQTKQALT